MRRLLPALVALAFLGGWALASTRINPVLLPSPLEVGHTLLTEGRIWRATATTAMASVGGLAIASVVALSLSVAFLRSRWLELALYPYALLLQTVPIVAIAPLLLVWLGYGTPVAVTSAAIVSFFPILTAGNVGLRAVEPAQVELLELYGASWWQQLIKLRVPASLPHLFAGYRTAVGLSVIGAIVGEFVASNGLPVSLGYVVLSSARSAQTGQTFGAVVASTLLALLLFGLVRGLEALALRGR